MFCSDISAPIWFIFSDSLPSQLIYYSHIPTAIIALIVGGFVFYKNRSLVTLLLLLLTLSFGAWSFLSLLTWVGVDSRNIMFVWSFFPAIYVAIYVLSFYFFYTFVTKQDAPLFTKFVLLLALLPVIILGVTGVYLDSFNVDTCEAVENGVFTFYYYALCLVIFLWILALGILEIFTTESREEKKKIFLLMLGLELFLLSFFLSSAVASYIDNFFLEQYGLFGMTIFIVFLSYLIVQYKAFEIKLIGAQALTIALVMIIAAQFTYVRLPVSYVLNGIALVLVLTAGYYLIRSIKQEVKRKEELEALTENLSRANARLKELDTAKSEFISIASHQLRTPLTAIKGYVSLLLEGSYGVLSQDSRDVLDKVYSVNDRLTHLVEDLLNVSRIEAGRIQYDFRPVQLADILTELYDGFMLNAKSKSLDVSLQLPTPPLPKILADPNKIKEVVSNLIDNSIKYTPEGSVTITLAAVGQNARITIADTGIGIKPEDKPNLFSKFTRSKETSRMVVGGAGLGLYVGKNFIDAHKGRIWADSEGPGKGSQFIVELPIVNTAITPGTTTQSRE